MKSKMTMPLTRRKISGKSKTSPLALRIAASILAFLFFVALFQPLFYRVDPAFSDLMLRLQSPSLSGAWLGTDALGQDVYSRVIAGFL